MLKACAIGFRDCFGGDRLTPLLMDAVLGLVDWTADRRGRQDARRADQGADSCLYQSHSRLTNSHT